MADCVRLVSDSSRLPRTNALLFVPEPWAGGCDPTHSHLERQFPALGTPGK